MPCQGGPSRQQLDDRRNEIDMLTRSLCYVCLEHPEVMNQEMRAWYENHKLDDKKRLMCEEKMQEGQDHELLLANIRDRLDVQLSDLEKEALGMKP